jgi:hypothetical protein
MFFEAWVPHLVNIDFPMKGSGFTLRQRLGPTEDQVAFLGAENQVWLFREVPQLVDFLARDVAPAPHWRDLIDATDHDLDLERVHRYNLWEMVDGTLRWGPGYEAIPCSELCVELAFFCDLPEVLDELGPEMMTWRHRCWRRIIPLVGSRIRFWGEVDTGPIDLNGFPDMIYER